MSNPTVPPATIQEYALKRFAAWRAEQEKLYNDPFIRILLLGQKGYGKTTICATARLPIHICSFDPGGTTSIRDEVTRSDGQITVDTRFEDEDLRHPKAFALWAADFEEMHRNDFFNALGTYVIDSGYLWMESLFAKQKLSFMGAVVNDVLPESAIKGKDLRNLFGHFLEANLYWTRRLLCLPCNVIFTCHMDKFTDPQTGDQETSILSPGQASKERVPIPFPEVYVIKKKQDGSRTLLTREEGIWRGSTRIGAKGKLDAHEPPNICGILRKCGLSTEPRTLEVLS